jgi:hypothetical protein
MAGHALPAPMTTHLAASFRGRLRNTAAKGAALSTAAADIWRNRVRTV